MSTYAYSDIYDCAACGEALAYPVDEEGEALDGGDLVCLTCVLSYVVDMRTGTLARAPAFIERLTADLATARRLLPPRYIAADGSILDPERCTPHAPDCAECGRGRAHDEGCLALLATPAEEVVGLQDRVERLAAERAALLAPVEGVDLEEVLRLDSEATQEPWRSYNAAPFKESIPLLTTDEIRRPMVRYEADEQLIVCYRTAAPALAREVIQLRAAVRFADEQGAEAIDRVSRAIVADKWNSTAQLQEEVKRLTAELEEARRGPGGVLAEVAAERARQIGKGYTAEHDDGAEMGELGEMAGLILLNDFDLCDVYPEVQSRAQVILEKYSDETYDGDRHRQIVIALALGVAEAERLERLRVAHPSTPPASPE